MSTPNPIRLYIYNLLASGKITLEKICVLSDLKYKTLTTNLERERVSPMVRMALKTSGVVPINIIQKYDAWYQKVFLKGKEHARKAASRNKNKSKKSNQGIPRTVEDKHPE